MIISTNAPGSGLLPRHPPRTRLLAAIDVEWTKNYRIRGGNVPFCYSVVCLALPDDDASTGLLEAAPSGTPRPTSRTPARPRIWSPGLTPRWPA